MIKREEEAMLRAVKTQEQSGSEVASHGLVENFKALYKTLNRDTLQFELLSELYHTNIEFQDPLHQISGLDKLYEYFEGLYENVTDIEFEFHDQQVGDEQGFLTWTMRYRHPYVNRGKWINVDGSSQLRFTGDKISSHRDYFDAGAMLYEHVPGIAFLIRQLKKRMG
jgi:hypothetical protein